MASDAQLHAALSKLLLPSETIKFASRVLVEPVNRSSVSGDASERLQAREESRYVGVISNVTNGREQAALILFKRLRDPSIIAVVPIFAEFQISISQITALPSSDARTRFRVEFRSPESVNGVSILVEDLNSLTLLIAEVRQLARVAKDQQWTSGGSNEWLEGYEVEDEVEGRERRERVQRRYSAKVPRNRVPTIGLENIEWGSNDDDTLNRSSLQDDQAMDVRDGWIADRVREREEEFVEREEIRIWCGTFNVNDKLPTEDLTPWLVGSEGSEIIVLGFQELDLSTEAMLRYTPHRERAWRAAIEKALGSRARLYEKVTSRQLVGAIIIVYALKSSLPYIYCVSSNSVATGMLGLIANKGATAIRIRYKNTYITFVNSHLAAFTSMVEKRNQEVVDIGRFMSFPLDGSEDAWAPDLRGEVKRVPGMLGIYDSDHLVWMGDLNYRIDLPREDVERAISSKSWEMLRRFDQLDAQKSSGLVWSEFEEAPIEFPPTFKFDVATSIYDTSEKQRTPSWTDRVLWTSIREGSIRALQYTSHPDIALSDHKPVSAILQVPVFTVNSTQRRKVLEETMATMDRYDGDAIPEIKVVPGPAIEFDVIEYEKSETKSMEFVNVGSVLAMWRFVLKPGTKELVEPWLTVSPTSGILLPGESTTISFTIRITSLTSPALNFAPPDSISELLILSIKHRDIFLSVSAREYLPTVFGCDIETLSRLARVGKSIRTATMDTIDALVTMEDGNEVSGEVRRMVDFLSEHGGDREDLFEVEGGEESRKVIRECLDTGEPFPSTLVTPTRDNNLPLTPTPSNLPLTTSSPSDNIDAMATTLLHYLDALPSPLVPSRFYDTAIRSENPDQASDVLDSLGTINRVTLLYITGFLLSLLERTPSIRRRARRDRLASIFSPILIKRPPSLEPQLRIVDASAYRFVQLLLTPPP